jgi:hypothetical protein
VAARAFAANMAESALIKAITVSPDDSEARLIGPGHRSSHSSGAEATRTTDRDRGQENKKPIAARAVTPLEEKPGGETAW